MLVGGEGPQELAAQVVRAADRLFHLGLGRRARSAYERRAMWRTLVAQAKVHHLDEDFLAIIEQASRWHDDQRLVLEAPRPARQEFCHRARAFLELANAYAERWRHFRPPIGALAHSRV